MKPDWKDAPEWAQWLAMDDDRAWYWHEEKPWWRYGEWVSNGTISNASKLQGEALEARPVMCGGCGETDPDNRCIGCRHNFQPTKGEWAMMGWQPIETAPKDGSVIVSGSYAKEYSGDYEPIETGRLIWSVELAKFDGDWRGADWHKRLLRPTHWMPLPEPPNE